MALLQETYARLGITDKMQEDRKADEHYAEDTAWCPATFYADGSSLLCELKKTHEGPHAAIVKTLNDSTTYCWPEIADDKACDDYLRRRYWEYTDSVIDWIFEEDGIVDVNSF